MTLGAIAALKSKRWDHLITSIMDIFEGVPDLLIAAVVAFALGNHPLSLALAISITGWVPMARLTRSVVFSMKDKEFINASYRLGASHSWVITKHVLPSCRSTLATGLILRLRSALFAEAFLGFLGLGIPDPHPSLGSLCAQGVHALLFYPWRVCFALIAIAATLLCFTFLGEQLDEKNSLGRTT
jgi:oligopeptide transport system permease protein